MQISKQKSRRRRLGNPFIRTVTFFSARRLRKRLSLMLLAVAMISQPACIWKLWQKKPPEERIYDVTGTVVSVKPDQLVIQNKKGQQEFVMVDSSIKGSDFKVGALVHVYYRILSGVKEVTMVVEKVKD